MIPVGAGSGPSRRFTLLAVAAVVVVAVWGIGRWASNPTYVTLLRDISPGTSGVVEERLQKEGVPHRLAAGGTEVQVPVADLARARVALAKEGFPGEGRPGLELFDKPSWGMTDFTQRVTYQRALEGELARTIQGIRGIEKAQVHLVLPSSSPLRRNDRSASASVVLTLQSGSALTSETIQGITFVVSNSVERLASDNVAVMDDAGHLLSVPSANGSVAGMTTWQMEIQRSMEEHLSGKVLGLLEPLVGMGRTRAEIAAELNFEQVDRTIETFDPESQVLESEQRSESEAGGAGDGSGAQVVISNSYSNSRRLEKSTGSVGKITRLTAAVLVDEKAIASAQGIDIDRIRSMVWNAIGADSARGDRLSVLAVPFEAAAAPATGEGAPGAKPKFDPIYWVERFGRIVVGLIAVTVLAIFGLKVLRSLQRADSSAQAPTGLALTGGSPQNALSAGVSPAEQAGSSNAMAEAGLRPEATAQVLKAWLSR